MLTRKCKVCGKTLTYGRYYGDNLCSQHQYTEGNVWVLNVETGEWTPKFLQSACR